MLMESSSADLIAYKIEPYDLEKIKGLYSSLARRYFDDITSLDPGIHSDLAIFIENTADNPRYEVISEILDLEASLIICLSAKNMHTVAERRS